VGKQSVVAGARQVPAPLQSGVPDSMPFWQKLAPHAKACVGKAHADRFVPLHAPAHAPVPTHAGRPARGAPELATHVPALPASSHASHCPEHAVSQHSPPTQKPLAHCDNRLQGVPGASLGTQTPAEQYSAVAQSVSATQPPAQITSPGSQPLAPQSCC
jgi:hypothetical protein